MNKEIRYTGYSTSPSDYDCPDGALALSLNLVQERDRLVPISAPEVMALLPEGTSQVIVHKISANLHNYVCVIGNAIRYVQAPGGVLPSPDQTPPFIPVMMTDDNGLLTELDIPGISRIDVIGNTLLVFTPEGIHYLLWQTTEGADQAYFYLGDHLPECSLQFGLKSFVSQLPTTDAGFGVTVDRDSAYSIDECKFDDDTSVKSATNQVLAKVNKFIAENVTNKGHFLFPFFIRYAYRLYDGSLVMHSAPILLIPSTSAPLVAIGLAKEESTDDRIKATDDKIKFRDCRVIAPVSDIECALISDNREEIKRWKDIIRSVDIFVSAPIFTYDQNGDVEGWYQTGLSQSERDKAFGVSFSATNGIGYTSDIHARRNVADLAHLFQYRWRNPDNSSLWGFKSYVSLYRQGTISDGILYFKVPLKDDDTIQEEIQNCSNFYLLKSYEIDEIPTDNFHPIEVPDDYLQSLTSRELMTDDWDSHDTIIPTYSKAHNARLNLANITKRLYQGYHPDSSFQLVDGVDDLRSTTSVARKNDFLVYVYIRQEGEDHIVCARHSAQGKPDSFSLLTGAACFPTSAVDVANNIKTNPFLYFYYPNTNAYKAVIYPPNGHGLSDFAVTLDLKKHSGLNGAYYFAGWNPPARSKAYTPSAQVRPDVPMPNKIYTSEVNNPFFFPVTNINTVGTGSIRGISTAAKALSQGQFGQFPLYAFTTDGVWALESTASGSFSAKQPISRDVMLPDTTPLQLDSSVIFATDRGLMLISGSQTSCISDPVAEQFPFDASRLPGIDKLHRLVGHDADSCIPTLPFLSFLDGADMIYDYLHQRIFVFNPDISYAYVYSLQSRLWGMTESNLALRVNSYPDALALDHDRQLLNFSSTASNPLPGLLLTRPLKLDAPDSFKTVQTVIQRGHFSLDKVADRFPAVNRLRTALYGSRDLIHWHLVWSSQNHILTGFSGTPYKYFRLAVVSYLADGESLSSASFLFSPKDIKRMH